MKKAGLPRDYKVYVVFALLLIALAVLMPRTGRFNYDYRKGSPWLYETLIARFDFPVLKTDAQLQAERESAGSGVVPYYKFSDDVVSKALHAVDDADLGKFSEYGGSLKDILSAIYSLGVISDNDGVFSDENVSVIYIQKDKRASKHPLSEVYRVSEAREELLSGISRLELWCDADSLCREAGLYEMVSPNLVFDEETTELVHEEAVDYISPTSGVVKAGQLIVSNGEMVTAEIQQLLDSYKAEYENSLGYDGPVILMWAGNFLLAVVLVFILFLTIYFANPGIFSEFNRFVYLIVIYFLTVLVTFLVERTGYQNMFLVPFSLMALFLVAFFKKRVLYPVYVASLLPMLIFVHNGTELFVMYLTAGVVAIFSFMKFNRGWQQFLTAFFVYISLLVTFFMFRLTEGIRGFHDYQAVFYLGLGSLLSVAGYPLIYLWERVFMLVSSSRLQELCDTNNKVLRELQHKAPGTFQHSLQVMNMADAVARAIDANADLVRCGALYHDIGKTLNPLCFIENETAGDNSYHVELSTLESAKTIIRHVSDGMALAEKAKLPEEVRQFITTHHGTTCTAYFYNKFRQEGGDPAEAPNFYYKGPKPSTKEQSILMLCDSIEAASRTLKDFSPESISDFVENICNGKINQGQFEEADISMKELFIVKAELKEYLRQAHHARVDYPKN